MILIDAHGPDHGLRVEVCTYSHTVTAVQWGELCEPDHEDEVHPRTTEIVIALRECLEYAAKDGRWHDSQRDRVICGALHYLSHWGGTVYWYPEGTTPCQHFDHDPAVPCAVCREASDAV